ncbi:hypothetical protein [Polyangium aurulentum]|uniref:hypothetical protein n=1 Tax=Polyangium aurulentum TaxID=2567896 RepID=UPI0010AECE01|nr:hypothetical protein [Polyangium aurulentum]UQA56254.1 hypothetical protein E8A73_033795 [Polyangium aurulentum]
MILTRRSWAALAAGVPLHIALALGTDLSPDEAYYLAAARAPGALPPLVDHPPLLPLLLGLTDRLTWLPVELRVRVWPILLSFALALATAVLARRRGARPEGELLAALLATFALLPTAGGFVATPDGPALLALVLGLCWAEPPKDEAPSPALRAALALGFGVMAAAGALSKVVVLPLLAILAVTARGRSLGERALVLVPTALTAPLLLPSLAFQLRHAYAQQAGPWTLGGALGALVAAVTGQALLWSPFVLWYGGRALRRLPWTDRAVCLGMTFLFGASALVRAVPPEPNWYAPAALILVVGAASSVQDLAPRARLAMLLATLLPTALAAAHTLRPFLPLPAAADPTARLHGWRDGDPSALDAAGVGPYGPAAERCVYQKTCEEINAYFRRLRD